MKVNTYFPKSFLMPVAFFLPVSGVVGSVCVLSLVEEGVAGVVRDGESSCCITPRLSRTLGKIHSKKHPVRKHPIVLFNRGWRRHGSAETP